MYKGIIGGRKRDISIWESGGDDEWILTVDSAAGDRAGEKGMISVHLTRRTTPCFISYPA
jgi:hypothetical protein